VTEVPVLAKEMTFDDTAPRGPGNLAVMLKVVAWPDRDHHDGGFGPEPDLFEQGACERCDVEIISTSRQAFCPACGDLCWLTRSGDDEGPGLQRTTSDLGLCEESG
jgi:hypothetical protein